MRDKEAWIQTCAEVFIRRARVHQKGAEALAKICWDWAVYWAGKEERALKEGPDKYANAMLEYWKTYD